MPDSAAEVARKFHLNPQAVQAGTAEREISMA